MIGEYLTGIIASMFIIGILSFIAGLGGRELIVFFREYRITIVKKPPIKEVIPDELLGQIKKVVGKPDEPGGETEASENTGNHDP